MSSISTHLTLTLTDTSMSVVSSPHSARSDSSFQHVDDASSDSLTQLSSPHSPSFTHSDGVTLVTHSDCYPSSSSVQVVMSPTSSSTPLTSVADSVPSVSAGMFSSSSSHPVCDHCELQQCSAVSPAAVFCTSCSNENGCKYLCLPHDESVHAESAHSRSKIEEEGEQHRQQRAEKSKLYALAQKSMLIPLEQELFSLQQRMKMSEEKGKEREKAISCHLSSLSSLSSTLSSLHAEVSAATSSLSSVRARGSSLAFRVVSALHRIDGLRQMHEAQVAAAAAEFARVEEEVRECEEEGDEYGRASERGGGIRKESRALVRQWRQMMKGVDLIQPIRMLNGQQTEDMKRMMHGKGINISRLSLLYRASRDGYLSSNFFQKCANKGNTISIIKLKGSESIFGCYLSPPLPLPSCSSPLLVSDPSLRSFMFSLVNSRSTPFILSLVDSSRAARVLSDGGVEFGSRVSTSDGRLISKYANFGLFYKNKSASEESANYVNISTEATELAYRVEEEQWNEENMKPAGFCLSSSGLSNSAYFAVDEMETFTIDEEGKEEQDDGEEQK